MKKLTILIFVALIFSSCKETKRIFIADHFANCTGVGQQKCMLIKENANDEWSLFYDQIKGFDYEEGFSYEVEVEINTTSNSPVDGSTLEYTLIKVISKEMSQSEKNLIIQQPITIEYEATSRGFYFATIVTQETIKTTKDRNRKETDSKTCSSEAWGRIENLLRTIEIENIDKLEAPSDKRLFDGAAHAQLKIITKDTTYISASFDHGAPPKQIEPLVNHILSLAESVEKE